MDESKISKVIAYYRVSTKKQTYDHKDKKPGETYTVSGLGLDAQREAVEQFARQCGAAIEAEYKEIESGRDCERIELLKALAHARMIKGTLVVAKLDRLSRNAAFTLMLMESGVDFVCCDNPHANRLTIHILAAVAENESRAISQRTKAALAVAKKNGQLLGSARPDHWKGREHKRGWKKGTKRAAVARTQKAKEHYEWILPKMQEWRDKDGLTYAEIADKLNEGKYPTSTGAKFNTTTVWRILNGYPARKKSAG